MADQDSIKDVLKPSDAPENTQPHELIEDDLKAVTGGLSNTMGTSLSSINTAVCVSSD